jgi:hypothetical protein
MAGSNIVQRNITVTASYVALSALFDVYGTVTISCPPANSGTVYFLGDDGEDVPWIPGEWHVFDHADLRSFQVKGTAGDTVTAIGGTL